MLRIQYGANGQPQLRFGKRAFVLALPAIPIGLAQHRCGGGWGKEYAVDMFKGRNMQHR